MKALVTGVCGFIGHNVAKKLLSLGYDVTGIDSLTDYYDLDLKLENLKELDDPRFRLVRQDINRTDLVSLMTNVDFVFHLAGQPGVRKSWGSDFVEYCESNVLATQRLLEAARVTPTLLRFVYSSSSSIYGNADTFPTPETASPQPVSPYGVTKLAGEHLCSLYASNFGVPTVSLRYFTVYGPRQRPDMAFTRFCRSAFSGQPVKIFGDGEQIRDFTYVDDVVLANFAAATVHTRPGSVFNVSGGSSVSVNQILALITRYSGRELKVEYVAGVAGDVLRTGGSSAAAGRELGWRPYVTIEEGLKRQVQWASVGVLGLTSPRV